MSRTVTFVRTEGVFSLGRALSSIENALLTITDTLYVWQKRLADRQNLRAMDDHMLADIGLDRADISREIAKPFWQA